VLATNVVSEVVIGNSYVITALVGSLMLLCCPKDVDEQSKLKERACRAEEYRRKVQARLAHANLWKVPEEP
jgi:hypothetical protein